jgi:hypothetical protein
MAPARRRGRHDEMLAESDFIVLNVVYLKKMAGAAQIAEATGLAADAVAQRLATAAGQGWLMDMGPAGAMLLEEGIAQVTAYYRDAYAGLRTDPALIKWYENFESLNERFIAVVSEWQKSEGDDRIERRVLQTAERLAKDIGQLVPRIARYASYPRRLERSMDRVDAGERDFVCKPTLDSVHNIWFEFHEDILAVLGRPRDTT